MRTVLAGTVFVLLFLPAVLSAQTSAVFDSEEHRFKLEVLATDLEHPWSMAFLPDGEVLISERPGRLRSFKAGVLSSRPVAGLPPVRDGGQGGLLDLAPHPQFAQNRWLYFSYAAAQGKGVTTHVARGRYENGRLNDVEVLFIALPASSSTHHFGSRLLFDDAGFLYITVGDRGDMDRAQRTDDYAGSTIRLHDDGSVPKDNPFIKTPNARPELYTLGNRNAQAMALHPRTRQIWQAEHGPRGGDELNLILPGRNYGWPVITYGINYIGTKIGKGITQKAGMEQPVYFWTPSIAPSGMAFYTGGVFAKWQGNLFVGALVQRHLTRLVMDGNKVVHEEKLLLNYEKRIRDVRQGPDGTLWLLTDEEDGALLRIVPAD